jgi:protein-tyrosine phosphatase
MMRTVLFLCTGNYYRSRFAEELFNHHALRAGLSWVARSRALAIECGVNNVGSLSPLALKALEKRGLVAKDGMRSPRQCAVVDLESADLIVALMDSEHRPLIRERFCGWENRVEYWQVGDVNVTQPDVALSSIETEIAALIEKLVHAQRGIRYSDVVGCDPSN